jgi:regulatory protein
LNDLQNKAKQYALKLLSYRGRSEKELKERLIQKGISETLVSFTADYLRKLGYLDDLSLAEALKREAIERKLLSQAGARQYLLKRGIPRDIVHSVFLQEEGTDRENAKKYIRKKIRMRENYPQETVRRRLYNQLLRRGYSPATIVAVLKDKNINQEE